MAVSVGNTSGTSGNLSSGFTFEHVVAAGSDKVLCVTWHTASFQLGLDGVDWNGGEAFSLVSSTPSGGASFVEIWALVDPTVTTADITITHSGGMHHCGAKGVDFSDAGTPSDGDNNLISSDTSTSITVSNVVSDDYVLDAVCLPADPSEGGGQTNFEDTSSAGTHMSASYQDGATDGVMSWSWSGNQEGGHGACRIPAAAAAAAWDQDKYAFGDDGTETGHNLDTVDTARTQLPDTDFIIRMAVQNSSLGAAVILKLQASLNGGTYADVTTSSSNVITADGGLTDGGDTTDRLGASGTFITDNNWQDETGAVASLTFAVGEQTEYVAVIQIVGSDTIYGDKLELRLVETDNTVLDTYTSTPLLWRDSKSVKLKQVEMFSKTMTSAETSVTYTLFNTITNGDISEAFMVFTYRCDNITSSTFQVKGVITNTTTLTFTRNAHGSAAINIVGYIAEFSEGVRVERGSISEATLEGAPAGEGSTVLSNIWDDTKAFCFHSFDRTVAHTSFGADDSYICHLTDVGDTLQINVKCTELGSGIDATVHWEAIQYKDCLVQRGTTTAMNATTITVPIGLSPVVDPDKTFFNCSFLIDGASGDGGATGLRTQHTVDAVTGDEFTIDREHHGSEILNDIRWEAIEFTGSETVQEIAVVFPDTDGSEDDPVPIKLSAVGNTGKAMALSGVDRRIGRSDYTTDLNQGVVWFSFELTSRTNLQSQRNKTSGISDTFVYVIDFDPEFGPLTEQRHNTLLRM